MAVIRGETQSQATKDCLACIKKVKARSGDADAGKGYTECAEVCAF